MPPGAHYESMLEALHSPATLRRIAAHAAWFREFATSFTPEGAQAPLVPANEAVVLIDGMPAEEPPLGPLQDADLEAALSYRAPTRKFWQRG